MSHQGSGGSGAGFWWLAGGALGAAAYLASAPLTRASETARFWLSQAVFVVPALVAALLLARQRTRWTGCQRLFWVTIALGSGITAVGQVGGFVDAWWAGAGGSWPGWRGVLGLFGFVAPVPALLAQPHRGPRVSAAPPTAIDIAGVTILIGFLYAYFVAAPSFGSETRELVSLSLTTFALLQQLLVVAVLGFVAWTERRGAWGGAYARLAGGALLSFAALVWTVRAAWLGTHRPGGPSDLVWMIPFVCYGWAAAAAPVSPSARPKLDDGRIRRPWVLFGVLAVLPIGAYLARRLAPAGPPVDDVRELSSMITMVSVLALFTARLATEAGELERADARAWLLARALQQTQDFVFILRADGTAEYANEAFCRALGYTPEELARLPQRQLVAGAAQPAFDRLVADVAQHGTARGALIRRRRDGSTFPSACVLVEAPADPPDAPRLVGVERDMTEDVRLRNQVIHAERLSALGQFVAGVAHEINNPLQAIVGCAELLLAREHPAPVREDLELVRAQAERAGQIVRNLLTFARRGTLERTPEDLSALVLRTVKLREPHLRRRQIAVELELAADLPPLAVSRDEIQQVVANLLLNAEQAVCATGRPGVIHIRTWADPQRVCLDVTDDGPGVPEEVRDRIFEPFFTTKAVGEGTGLGLSVSLGIARAHGGTLELLPASRGARFRLTLPRGATPPSPV